MTEETLFETERTRDRAEIASLLRSLASQFDDGTVTLAADGRSVAVQSPERATVEIELERERTDDGTDLELEVEIEWTESTDAEGVVRHEDDVRETGAPATGEATAAESLARFEVFRDRADEWRWRLVHRNGNVIADGGEGYASKQNALKGLRSVRRNAPGARIDVE
ncbi:HVO_2922 family protein [Halococcus agarilyticus]|uniref:HVO_2922 family protein n=1 Tax=Halococcus agarilyticus TaxID=1232219 RepID=UPI0006775A88|nr:HVO_2922 family protein [Halococcus agarilyticus]